MVRPHIVKSSLVCECGRGFRSLWILNFILCSKPFLCGQENLGLNVLSAVSEYSVQLKLLLFAAVLLRPREQGSCYLYARLDEKLSLLSFRSPYQVLTGQ